MPVQGSIGEALQFGIVSRTGLEVEYNLFIFGFSFEKLAFCAAKLDCKSLVRGRAADEVGQRTVIDLREPNQLAWRNFALALLNRHECGAGEFHLIGDGLLGESGRASRFLKALA